MNRNLLARSIAVLFLGILFGYYVDYDERKTRQMDREQYIERETRKFDDLKSDPTPRAAMIIGAVVVISGFLFLYEILVLGISATLKSKGLGAEKPAGGASIPFS